MSNFKPGKGWLVDKVIPKGANGDPNFTWLGPNDENTLKDGQRGDAVLDQFTPEEVVYLVNKQLYSLEYQRETHRKRAAEEREQLAPVKKKVKSMFGLSSYLLATEEQLQKAIEACAKDRMRDTENLQEHKEEK